MGWPSLSDVTNAISNNYRAARDTVSDVADSAASAASGAANAVASTVSSAATTVRDTASSTYNAASSAVSDFSASARERAGDLAQAGLDAGRRGVEAVRDFDVREAAATVRDGIGRATEAGREGIGDATRWTSERVGEGADWARAQVDGDDFASRTFRDAVTVAEGSTRFSLGVTGGIAREVVGTVGAVGQLGVTGLEMQVSREARLEYGATIANGVTDAGRAAGGYLQSVADDPSRLRGDLQGAADAAGGFIGDTAQRYGQAIREGRTEEIGMDLGTAATYIAPIGGGPARGALTAGVRGTAQVAAREGGEALVRTSAGALAREGGEAVVRGTADDVAVRSVEAAATRGAADLTEQRGAALIERMTANGGTAPLEQGAGRIADLSAASRQSGRELAVYRDGATGQRMVTMGAADQVSVPAGSRLIAHTQPGVGPAALTPSAADLAGLGALGQRSSAIVDQAGGIARYSIDDATRASATRSGAGEAVTFEAPRGGGVSAGGGTAGPAPGTPAAAMTSRAQLNGTAAPLSVDRYGPLAQRSVGDGMTPDHIPSFAAVRERVEQQLGRPLTADQARQLRSDTNTVLIETQLHQQTSRTYGGRNTPAQIASDAADLERAANLDMAALRPQLAAQGFTSQQIDAAFDAIHDANRAAGLY